MKNQEWTIYKKEEWPERGPWDAEPDKTQFTDEATGLPCLTVRNHHGNWCGYIGVPEGHPFYGVSYSDCPLNGTPNLCTSRYCDHSPGARVSVHGGLTFSDFCQTSDPQHGICHVPDPGEPEKVWWLGFDCAHYMDYTPPTDRRTAIHNLMYPRDRGVYRDLAYVQQECRSLAAQLKAIAG